MSSMMMMDNEIHPIAIRYTFVDQMIYSWLFFVLNGDERDKERKAQMMIMIVLVSYSYTHIGHNNRSILFNV